MPELPEVHTTVEGVKKFVVGKTIKDVWSEYHIGAKHGDGQNIKNKKYFQKFKKIVKGAKIIGAERRGKNVLIYLNPSINSGQVKHTIIIHMKMTGHLLYGVSDKFIHLVFKLKNAKDLALSDMRKFASVAISKTNELHLHHNIGKLGPEPLHKSFSGNLLYEQLQKRKSWPIKSALLDQTILAGIGNIYSDEILWETSIHPLSKTGAVPRKKFNEIFKSMQKILKFSIKHGGDSKSDYRNILGEKGGFQDFHKVYGKRGQKCPKPRCGGIIERMIIKGRSSHFCPKHQILYK